MEAILFTFRLRSKTYSGEEIAQCREHREVEIIGAVSEAVSCRSQKWILEWGLILNWCVRKCFQEKQKQVCDNEQNPAEENFGSIYRGDLQIVHFEFIFIRGQGRWSILYPCTFHSLDKGYFCGTYIPGNLWLSKHKEKVGFSSLTMLRVIAHGDWCAWQRQRDPSSGRAVTASAIHVHCKKLWKYGQV